MINGGIIGTGGSGTGYRTIELNNIQIASNEKWEQVGNFITEKYDFSGCLIGNEVYTFDGKRANGSHISASEKYNLLTQKPTSIAQQTSKFVTQYGCESNGSDKIWIFGGLNNYGGITSWLFRYNVTTNNYTDEADMPFSAISPVVIRINSTQILVAGENGGGKNVYYFNFITKDWTNETQSPVSLAKARAVIYNDIVYFVKDNKIYTYNLSSKAWDTLAVILTSRSWQYVFLVGSHLHICGGLITNTGTDSVEIIDLDAPSTPIAGLKLNSPKGAGLAITHNETPYILGGYPITNTIERYTPKSFGSNPFITIASSAKVQLNKPFLFEGETRSANVEHELEGFGVLQLMETNTSGTITEKIKNIELTQL